jgi:hypothetical protein
MHPPHYTRSLVALVAAYALALQTVLLTFGGAVAAVGGGAGSAICAHRSADTGVPPVGPGPHSQGCLAACLTGCCCALIAVPPPSAQATRAPRALTTSADATAPVAIALPRVTGRHRSRAPPIA